MNRRRFIALFLLVIVPLSLVACTNQDAYLSDVELGDSQADIQKQKEDWGEPFIEDDGYLFYDTVTYFDFTACISYAFEDDRLVQAYVVPMPQEDSSREKYLALCETLKEQYGEPSEVTGEDGKWDLSRWDVKSGNADALLLCAFSNLEPYGQTNNLTLMLTTQAYFDAMHHYSFE